MSKKQHLIFTQSYFYPDHSAGSQMLSDLAFNLVQNGFKVSVITSRNRYGNQEISLPKFEVVNNVRVYRKWSSKFGRRYLIGRIIDYLSLEFSMLIGIMRLTKKNDIVVILTDPPLLNILALPVIKFRGGLIVNWLQDLFPEVAVGAGILSQESLLNKFIIKIRNNSLNSANMNVVIGNHMKDYLIKNDINIEKIIRIPNWADGDLIKPIDKNANYLRKEWGLEGRFVVGYSGNLGRAHDILTILKTINKLKNNNQIVFLFIGGGVGVQKIKKYVTENQLHNVIFKPYQARKLLHLSLGAADLHWVTLEPQMEAFIVPSKIYGILAAAKPVIFLGDKNGELAKVISKIGCGKVVEIGNSDIMASTIKEFSRDLSSIKIMGNLGRVEFQSMYELNISVSKFSVLFQKLIDSLKTV